MIVFINDIPVRWMKGNEEPDPGHVNVSIDATADPISRAMLINHVHIRNVRERDIDTILDYLNSNVPTALLSLYLSIPDYDKVVAYFKKKFKVIKAAGGLVRKKEKFLMIYRLKKWDLPKGKKEKGERYKETAVREIEEECNITVKLDRKICTTWHTYTMNRRPMLKKTRWYAMDLVDDSRMKPNTDEDIEEVRWMRKKEVYHALDHSYESISYVFQQYYALFELKIPPQSL
ncbi:MAG TPA: NUDIX domain-containing protein [Cyclobacteriaceae bacterium]|nr:NUDIX domain-containing protein [Cyclobacteriaceae bacterium]